MCQKTRGNEYEKIYSGRHVKKFTLTIAVGEALTLSAPLIHSVAQENGAALAQSIDGGGRVRMNLAARLTVLGQTVAAAACMLDSGYDIAHEWEVLEETHEDFTRLLWALEHGDMTVGIATPERNRSAVVAIRDIHAIWEPIDASAIALLEGDHPHDHAGANKALLEKTELLASIIVNEYADPFEVLLTDAAVIDDFSETINMFGTTLTALHDGYEAAGWHHAPLPC